MKLKVCGMKDGDNISAVAGLQPDYMGFIFYPKSKRFFTGTLPEMSSDIVKTAVFVNEDLNMVLDRVKEYSFEAIQLHGDESASYCSELKKALSPAVQLIKAFSMHKNFDMTRLLDYQSACDFFLFDTKGKERGGTGQVFDWNILKSYDLKHPFFLSGGIGLDQIEHLKAFFETEVSNYCHAVDVNSKFEDLPGLKRVDDLELFINEIRSVRI